MANLPVFVAPLTLESQRGAPIVIDNGKMWYLKKKRPFEVVDDDFDIGGLYTCTLNCQTKNCGCTAQVTWNEYPLAGESPWSNFHEREGKEHSEDCITDDETICLECCKDRVYQLLQASSSYYLIIASYTVQEFVGKPDLTPFFAYVRASWVEGGVVPTHIWSFYGNHGRRSTCDCEGYHSKIARKFETTKSLWKFLNKLQIEENDVHEEIETVPLGGLLNPFTAAQRARENAFADYRYRYTNDINFGNLEYIRAIAKTTLDEDIEEVANDEV